jgi:hypothetical protein
MMIKNDQLFQTNGCNYNLDMSPTALLLLLLLLLPSLLYIHRHVQGYVVYVPGSNDAPKV